MCAQRVPASPACLRGGLLLSCGYAAAAAPYLQRLSQLPQRCALCACVPCTASVHSRCCSGLRRARPCAGGGGGCPEDCADRRTCSHVKSCRYEDEGVSVA